MGKLLEYPYDWQLQNYADCFPGKSTLFPSYEMHPLSIMYTYEVGCTRSYDTSNKKMGYIDRHITISNAFEYLI